MERRVKIVSTLGPAVGSPERLSQLMEAGVDVVRINAAHGNNEQRATLIGLGLNKMHRRRTLEDTPAVRGMIARVQHLVRVVDEA